MNVQRSSWDTRRHIERVPLVGFWDDLFTERSIIWSGQQNRRRIFGRKLTPL